MRGKGHSASWVGPGTYAIRLQREPHGHDWPLIYRVSVIKNVGIECADFGSTSHYKVTFYCHHCQESHTTTESITLLRILPGRCKQCRSEDLHWSIGDLVFSDVGIATWLWRFRCNGCDAISYVRAPWSSRIGREVRSLKGIDHLIADPSVAQVIAVGAQNNVCGNCQEAT